MTGRAATESDLPCPTTARVPSPAEVIVMPRPGADVNGIAEMPADEVLVVMSVHGGLVQDIGVRRESKLPAE